MAAKRAAKKAKKAKMVIDVGRLALEELGGWLTGELALPRFAPLLPRGEKAMVEIEPVSDDPTAPDPVLELDVDARRGIEWLLANEAAAAEAVKAAVARAKRDAEVELTSVHFHDVPGGAAPYIGYSFDDPEDDEHGFGVMMHGTRVVKVGQADTAILEWIAERDAKERAAGKTAAKKKAAPAKKKASKARR